MHALGGRRRPPRSDTAPTVAVTGAAGRVGEACLRALASTPYRVIAIDVRRGTGPGEWRKADLRKASAAKRALAGATHLVHLAGHPAPDPIRPVGVLVDNVAIAANVLEAFANGTPVTAAVASSTSAYGMVFSPKVIHPDYVPVDEDHPCRPQDPYGLSKVMLEQLAAMWTRREGFTTVALRFPWASGAEPERVEQFLGQIDANPIGELGRRHLWTYVHVDDVADAFVRSLAVVDGEAHALNIASPEIPGGRPAADLIAACHPTTEIRAGIDDGFLATGRARATLGWSPTRSLSHAPHREA